MVSWETVTSLPVVQGPVLTPLLGTKELSKELPGKLYPCPRQSTPRWLPTLPLPSSTGKRVAALSTGSLPPTSWTFGPYLATWDPLGHSFFWRHCGLAPEIPTALVLSTGTPLTLLLSSPPPLAPEDGFSQGVAQALF